MSRYDGRRVRIQPPEKLARRFAVPGAMFLIAGASWGALALVRAHQEAASLQAACMSNIKQYATGMLMYVQDYDEILPPMKLPAQVEHRVMPYIRNDGVFSCPATSTHYIPNSALTYKPYSKILDPARVVLLRDARPHPAATDSSEGMPVKPWWNAAYVDGHTHQELHEPPTGRSVRMKPPPPLAVQLRNIRVQKAALRSQMSSLQDQLRKLKRDERRLQAQNRNRRG